MGVEPVLQNYINGEFLDSEKHLDNYDPSTGKVWGKIPDSDAKDVDKAVKAATQAFPSWSSMAVEQRSAIMMKVADLIEKNLLELAELESRDQGKPVSLATEVDIPRAVHNFRFFATNVLHQTNKSRYLEPAGALEYTGREPVGVAGLISPWNLPLYLLTFKIAPALAWGNCVVCKPSEMTSVTAWKLCSLINQAGVPPGVVNMVFGTGAQAGAALVSHPDVRLVSFTGSTLTASRIRQACANMCKKLSLELGGKNPAVVFSDADMDKCIPGCVRSSFANQGEICLCTSRIFVQRAVYDSFLKRFTEETRKITVGDPADKSTRMGALVSREHLAKVQGYVDLAHQGAGRVLYGYGVNKLELPQRNREGYFMLPTVITDTPDDGRLMQEEIFGPVTCIVPFDTEEEVIRRANNVDYGLSATVWSQDVSCVHRVASKLKAGTVWANCWLLRDLHMPFGGVKASGVGREGADDSRDFFTEAKTVCIKI